ncbi:MAG: FecR domain-containing protein [Myxococcota bacterium]|nr:FecR domain-containing protein [Myxococcota bacterium]
MREFLTLIAVAAAVLILGGLGYRALFAPGAEAGMQLSAVQGEVFRVGDQQLPAQVGDRLAPSETLVAGPDGSATLEFGEGSALKISSGTRIRVLDGDQDTLRIELEDGQVEATLRGGPGLGVVSGEREIRAQDADFQVARAEDSTYVRSERGELQLQGFGDLDTLGPDQVLVAPDQGAMRVDEASRALLMEVEWPGRQVRQPTLPIVGRCDPGSQVALFVDGVSIGTVIADSLGQWSLEAPLDEGPNPVRVVITDPLGRSRTLEEVVDLDTRPPQLTVEVAVPGG